VRSGDYVEKPWAIDPLGAFFGTVALGVVGKVTNVRGA